MLIICGALVNGPYALITTAVSADLVRGAPQTPPHCPGTPRGCSLFPRGMFCWDFSILPFPMLLKPSGEGQSCHTWCCIPHPPLNTGVSPVAFWPHDCVSALLHLSLTQPEWKYLVANPLGIPAHCWLGNPGFCHCLVAGSISVWSSCPWLGLTHGNFCLGHWPHSGISWLCTPSSFCSLCFILAGHP